MFHSVLHLFQVLLLSVIVTYAFGRNGNCFQVTNVKYNTSSEASEASEASTILQDTFNARSLSYIDTCLSQYPDDNNVIILQASRGLAVNEESIQNKISQVANNEAGSDFHLVDLIRILYFNTSNHESQIKSAMSNYRFWLTVGENDLTYWSENKNILFMSSHWLCNELYGWHNYSSDTLRSRLAHWLELKVQFGYYEFFSKVYTPYTLNALLNLVDFAKDAEIISLAKSAVQRLLKDLLLVSNSRGAAFSIAGRDYWKVLYESSGHTYNTLIYLLTGVYNNAEDISPSRSAVHLATSSIDVSDVYTYWDNVVDTHLYLGHHIDQIDTLNDDLTEDEQVLFLWSTGECCSVSHALQSKGLMDRYDLYDHRELLEFQRYEGLSDEEVLYTAAAEAPFFVGREHAGVTATIYKHSSTTLNSLDMFHPSVTGVQTVPWVAGTGTVAVWSAVGYGNSLPPISDSCINTALPYINQSSNAALLVFYPDSTIVLATAQQGTDTNVIFHWPKNNWDETITNGIWFAAREEEAYIALAMTYNSDNTTAIEGTNSLFADALIQAWVVVVGNAATHSNFNNFVSTVSLAEYFSNISVVDSKDQLYSTVSVDGKVLSIFTTTQ